MAQTGHTGPSLPQVTSPSHCDPGVRGWAALAYDLHEDLLPVLAGLEAMAQGRALGEHLQLLLQEALPAQVV